jgi:hypothetical protein
MTEHTGGVWPTTSQVRQTDKITALSQSDSWSQGCHFITPDCSGYQDWASNKAANILLYFNNKSWLETLCMASI